MGRDTTGVIGVSLKKNNDFVVEMDVVDEKAHLLSVTENGYGKRSEVSEYRYQGRGGSGVINVRVTEKNGPVVGIKSVTDADQLLLITERGQLIRIKVNGIRETGRAAQGVLEHHGAHGALGEILGKGLDGAAVEHARHHQAAALQFEFGRRAREACEQKSRPEK